MFFESIRPMSLGAGVAAIYVLGLFAIPLAARSETPLDCSLTGPHKTIVHSPPRTKSRVGLSLRRMQSALDKQTLSADTPLPLTRVRGLVVTPDDDIVVYGVEESGTGLVPVIPDDIILAMRSMVLSHQPPGMSLDPVLEGGKMADYQKVDYFGGIRHTRIGAAAFESDYWMKEVAAGARRVPAYNFCSYADRLVSDGGVSGVGESKETRFWFYPRQSKFLVSRDRRKMRLEGSGLEVLTETQHGLFQKGRLGRLYAEEDSNPHARAFAQDLTARLDELSTLYPDLGTLRNFFALAEVFKWLDSRGVRLGDWRYLLHDYEPVSAYTPPRADTVTSPIAHLGGGRMLTLQGGVQIEVRLPSKPSVDSKGLLEELTDELLDKMVAVVAPYWWF